MKKNKHVRSHGSNTGDRLGITPLMQAVAHKDTTTLINMISSGEAKAGMFVKDADGRTALDWARFCRNELAVKLLSKEMEQQLYEARERAFQSVSDIEISSKESNKLQSKSLLDLLKSNQEQKALDLLVDTMIYRDVIESFKEKFFTDIPDVLGSTPLMLAAGRNMLTVVQKLIDMRVPLNDGNRHGHNPLIWASICGHADMVRVLLYRGADIYHKSEEGRTALHYACLYSKARVANTLLDFLFQKFQTYRQKHPLAKFDESRWSKYATMLENFMYVYYDIIITIFY